MGEAWILGGSSGLGKELADEAKQRGLIPVILGRNAAYEVDLADWKSVDVLCKLINVMDEGVLRSADFFIWNAADFEYASFDKMEKLIRLTNVNIYSPTRIIQTFVARKKALSSSFHLIAISSVASWKARANMAVYNGSKAYQAQFARCLSVELNWDLPGSKVTVVMPSGMKTGLFPSDVDTTNFMDPKEVASIVWKEALAQEKHYDWFNVFRDGPKPLVSRDNFSPELAYDKLPRYNSDGSSKVEDGA